MTWKVGKHILRYLSGTKELTIAYSDNGKGAACTLNDLDRAVKGSHKNRLLDLYWYTQVEHFVRDLCNNQKGHRVQKRTN